MARRTPSLSLAFECPLQPSQLSPSPDEGGRERWCGVCQRTVYDLSKRPPLEARSLLRRTRTRPLCVAYRVDAHARPVFARTTLDRIGVALATAALVASTGCIGFTGPEWEAEHPGHDPDWDPVEPYEAPAILPPEAELHPPNPSPAPEPFVLPEPEIVEFELESESFGLVVRDIPGVVEQERRREFERREMLRELERQAETVGSIVTPADPGPERDSG